MSRFWAAFWAVVITTLIVLILAKVSGYATPLDLPMMG